MLRRLNFTATLRNNYISERNQLLKMSTLGPTEKENNIIETNKGNIKVITLDKPRKKNATDHVMYSRITEILNDAATNQDISIVVLTGNGDFYSSGNDISRMNDIPADTTFKILQEFIKSFITFPKILVSIVNGPAIGIAAVILPLFDFVFASDKAYFYTPFTKLRIVAEGCSTVTFPKLMGDRMATKMLIMNHKMSANEALEYGLISDLYKEDELQKKAWDQITEISELSIDSVLTTKKLLRRVDMDELIKTNALEIQEAIRINRLKV